MPTVEGSAGAAWATSADASARCAVGPSWTIDALADTTTLPDPEADTATSPKVADPDAAALVELDCADISTLPEGEVAVMATLPSDDGAAGTQGSGALSTWVVDGAAIAEALPRGLGLGRVLLAAGAGAGPSSGAGDAARGVASICGSKASPICAAGPAEPAA